MITLLFYLNFLGEYKLLQSHIRKYSLAFIFKFRIFFQNILIRKVSIKIVFFNS